MRGEGGLSDSGLTGCRGNSVFTHRFSPGCTDIGRRSRSRASLCIIPPLLAGPTSSFFFVILKCNTLLPRAPVSRTLFPYSSFLCRKIRRPLTVVSSFVRGQVPCVLSRTGLPRQTTTRTMRPVRAEWGPGGSLNPTKIVIHGALSFLPVIPRGIEFSAVLSCPLALPLLLLLLPREELLLQRWKDSRLFSLRMISGRTDFALCLSFRFVSFSNGTPVCVPRPAIEGGDIFIYGGRDMYICVFERLIAIVGICYCIRVLEKVLRTGFKRVLQWSSSDQVDIV